jgi:hypothetical protein
MNSELRQIALISRKREGADIAILKEGHCDFAATAPTGKRKLFQAGTGNSFPLHPSSPYGGFRNGTRVVRATRGLIHPRTHGTICVLPPVAPNRR